MPDSTSVSTPPARLTSSAPRGGAGGGGALDSGGAGQFEVEGLAADALVDVEEHGDARVIGKVIMEPITEPMPLTIRKVQPRSPVPSRKPPTPPPLRAAARKAKGITMIDATTFAMTAASSWMPKTRHQEPRTSFVERPMAFLMPCFSSIRAGEASEKRTMSHTATTALASRPRTVRATPAPPPPATATIRPGAIRP